jgi:hypothetical protein
MQFVGRDRQDCFRLVVNVPKFATIDWVGRAPRPRKDLVLSLMQNLSVQSTFSLTVLSTDARMPPNPQTRARL